MQSEPSSGIKLTAYSCICWLFHRIHDSFSPHVCAMSSADVRKHNYIQNCDFVWEPCECSALSCGGAAALDMVRSCSTLKTQPLC